MKLGHEVQELVPRVVLLSLVTIVAKKGILLKIAGHPEVDEEEEEVVVDVVEEALDVAVDVVVDESEDKEEMDRKIR